MDELEEIQAGQRKGFEAMHTSHWQFYFVLFCLLDFVYFLLSLIFFFFSAHLFYAKRLICLSWLICRASGFKSVPPKTAI